MKPAALRLFFAPECTLVDCASDWWMLTAPAGRYSGIQGYSFFESFVGHSFFKTANNKTSKAIHLYDIVKIQKEKNNHDSNFFFGKVNVQAVIAISGSHLWCCVIFAFPAIFHEAKISYFFVEEIYLHKLYAGGGSSYFLGAFEQKRENRLQQQIHYTSTYSVFFWQISWPLSFPHIVCLLGGGISLMKEASGWNMMLRCGLTHVNTVQPVS